jgi:hypothetical protein
MKKTIFTLFTLFTLSHAGGCVLVQSGDMNVTWKAYKTLAKVGVGGVFTSVKYTPIAKEGANFRELLVGSTVSIDATQIDTGNPTRDDTLVKMFFKQLKSTTIEGKIVAMKADKRVKGKPYTGVLDVELTFNSKTLTIPMKYTYVKEYFSAEGTLDLFDFAANDALTSINKSCYDLHKGKTWNDVSIGFTTNIKATLCKVDLKK